MVLIAKTILKNITLNFLLFDSFLFVFIFVFQTVETTLHKDSGGLGFSIAGGRGSLPYKGNDEVCSSSCCNFFPLTILL